MRIRLTPAQRSALECAGLDDAETRGEIAVRRAWFGGALVFDAADVEAIASGVNDLSNAEDDRAREGPDPDRPFARRAARALSNLYLRLCRIKGR